MTSVTRELELMNPTNRSHRRCRIVNVREKSRAEDSAAYRAAIRELHSLKDAIEQSTGKWRLPTSGGWVPTTSSSDVPPPWILAIS